MKIPILYDIELFVRSIRDNIKKRQKKIIIIGTSIHDNIGDSAISFAERKFAEKFFSKYSIIEINTYEYWNKIEYLKSIIKSGDMIWCQGGGNLGNRYINEEKIRRSVISTFRNNKIFIFPQSIWFSDDENGREEIQKSAQIYDENSNLILFCRDPYSHKLAQEYFKNTISYLTPDIVCFLKYNFGLERKGILACIRDFNDESNLSEAEYNQCINIINSLPEEVRFSKNRYGNDIPQEIRKQVVLDELKKFARSELVITDRLHGVIFSIVTGTKCIVLKSKDHKIPEFLTHLKGCDSISYINKDISLIPQKVHDLLSNKKVIYPSWERDFKNIAKIIKRGKNGKNKKNN